MAISLRSLLTLGLVLAATPVVAQPYRPQLTVVGNHFEDPQGNRVILRGLSSMGMGMVYGDKGNPGTYIAPTWQQYIDKATGTDADGQVWYSTAIRLVFERQPILNSARLPYSSPTTPWAIPETVTFSAWASGSTYTQGTILESGGRRYIVSNRYFRGDVGIYLDSAPGTPWNPEYNVGDLVTSNGALTGGDSTRLFRVAAKSDNSASGTPNPTWDKDPWAVCGATTGCFVDGGTVDYTWDYVGLVGAAGNGGTTAPSAASDSYDFYWSGNHLGRCPATARVCYKDISPSYTTLEAEANFDEWRTTLLEPIVDRAIANGLYVVICNFDFGPAHHPLLSARMLDFWPRIANGKYKNHPQVIFELWNESEDAGDYAGGPGSWSAQKSSIQAVVNAIRATGANNIIISPTPMFSAFPKEAVTSPLTGSNIAYALHAYDGQWDYAQVQNDQIIGALQSSYPIVMTEWGTNWTTTTSGACSNSDGHSPAISNYLNSWPYAMENVGGVPQPSLRSVLEPSVGAESYAAAGWFAWAHTRDWCPSTWNDTSFTQPTVFGLAVRSWLNEMRNDSQPIPPVGGGASRRPRMKLRGKGGRLAAAVFSLGPVLLLRRRRKGDLQ